MKERIMTLHPKDKKGTNVLKLKYDFIKKHILDVIKTHKIITFQDLSDILVEQLQADFDGKVIWYVVTVKLDLEARGIIERIPETSPHQLKLS